MTEIKITDFVNNADTRVYSNSIANSGMQDIGKVTWNNAKKSEFSFINKSNKQDCIDFFKEYGAWDDLDKWPIKELNALFIQMVSGDLNEMDAFDSYEEYEASEQVSHNIFKSGDDWYFGLYH